MYLTRPLSLVLLAATLAAVTPVSAQEATATGASAPREKRPKGKWPWFKQYRKKAQAAPDAGAASAVPPAPPVVTPVPAAAPPLPPTAHATPEPPAPARRTHASPSAAAAQAPPPATAAPGAPAESATSPMAQRRHARVARGSAPAPRAGAPSRPMPPAPTGMSLTMSRFDRAVRRELEISSSWSGSPPVRELTSKSSTIAAIEPLQQKLAAVSGPGSAVAHAQLAGLLLKAGLDQAAAAECLASLESDTHVVAAWNDLATALRRAHAYPLAESALRQAIALDPAAGLPRFNLALLRDAQGRATDAENEYVKALELDPSLWVPEKNPLVVDNPRARDALHRLYVKQKSAGAVLVDDSAGAAAAPR